MWKQRKRYVGKTKDTSTGNGEEITLRYAGWGSNSEKKATQKVIDKFEEEHPNIKVEYLHIPTDYNTKLTTMMAAGQEPDVAMVTGDTALQWATEGKLKNILEMAEGDEDFNIDDVLPQTVYWWDEGKACGINSALEVYTLIYNTDSLKEAGIEVPTKAEDAWSWDEFVEVLQKLTIDQNGKMRQIRILMKRISNSLEFIFQQV